jgi:hypothetical protein
MGKFTVIKDTREKEGWQFNKSVYCNGTVCKGLKTGDYTLEGYEHIICVERKRSPEEVSINVGKKKKQFDNELARMMDIKHRYIICEFSVFDLLSYPQNAKIPKFLKNKVRMKGDYILKCLLEYAICNNVQLLFCGNPENAKTVALSLFKRIVENEKL